MKWNVYYGDNEEYKRWDIDFYKLLELKVYIKRGNSLIDDFFFVIMDVRR